MPFCFNKRGDIEYVCLRQREIYLSRGVQTCLQKNKIYFGSTFGLL